MNFIAQFYPNGFRVIAQHRGYNWVVAASSREENRIGDPAFASAVVEGDGDFEGEADSLEQFMVDNIEKFL